MFFSLRTLVSVALPVALSLPLPAAGSESPMLLVSLRSRGVLCDDGEACSGGACASDPNHLCSSAQDCPRCLTVENEDVALCRPLSLGPGTTSCRWSLFFDGSAAGLDAPIRALDILDDGSLLMRAAADNSIPDIAGVNRKDLVRFLPTDERGQPLPGEIPYTKGEWQLFLDGDAVERNSEGRLMESIDLLPESCRDVNLDGMVEPQECDLLFTPFSAGELAGLDIAIEDVIRCRPTSLSEGRTVESCDYALFYDASEVNDADPSDGVSDAAMGSWRNGGSTAFAVDDFDPVALTATVYYSAGNEATLPAHQPSRDLLCNAGPVGPSGHCDDAFASRCLSASDCGAGIECIHDANPQSESTTVLFDGSMALGGEMLAAVAVVGDFDGDGVPDPLDNCRTVANPGACDGSGSACATNLDCAEGEHCRQRDSDDDGVGDACDRCHGRDDAECFCGDSIVDAPSEQCDLGAPELDGYNGLDTSPCSAECRIVGRCTRSQDACVLGEDCPEYGAGEGCCGNGTVDRAESAEGTGDEMCDDANAVPDDGCDNQCRIADEPAVPLPEECEGLIGPKIVPTFVRTLRFQKQRRQVPADREPNNYSKWSSRGEFSLVPGIEFDPDTQSAEIIFNQGDTRCDAGPRRGEACSGSVDCPDGRCTGTLYRAVLPPGTFAQAGLKHDRPRWSFKDRNGTVAGAPGWTKGRFSQRLATIRRPLNQIRFMLQGRGDRLDPQWTLTLDPNALGGPPTRVRQTIVIGDLCTTQSLVCEGNRAGTTLQCFSKVE